MSIIIGLGTGRCGTLSLADLINSQANAVCFHEINPACMSWSGSYGTVFSMLQDLQSILDSGPHDRLAVDLTGPHNVHALERLRQSETVDVIGEVSFYYLPYVEQIVNDFPAVKFPCLRRPREATVKSYEKKMLVPWKRGIGSFLRRRPMLRNHFVSHEGNKWAGDSMWDKCYPKFNSDTLEEAIEQYWNYYYEEASRLAEKYPQVRIFEMEDLNHRQTQAELLEFCGLGEYQFLQVQSNRSG
jgi:hypothetical protein